MAKCLFSTCTHLWTLSRTFWGVCMHPYTGARVSNTYARTHVPTPRRFLSKPCAAFYVYLFLLLFLCVSSFLPFACICFRTEVVAYLFCMQSWLFARRSYEIRYGRPFPANRACKSSIRTILYTLTTATTFNAAA